MPHREKPFSPAPPSRVASAHQGPRVLGFTNPDHRLPAMPAQPGEYSHGSAKYQGMSRTRSPGMVAFTTAGPAQPGLKKLATSANSAGARRSPLRLNIN
eukprot:5826058-Amphidinium_carterae.1